MLGGKVNYVRTYRATDGGDVMPEIANRNGLKLVPGAWIYSASEAKQQFGREASEVNAEETRALIRMANQNPNIERVLVGNENILRWDGQKNLRDPNATSPAQLIREIRNVKRNVKVPVSTAEPWHVWLRLSRARARGRLSRRPHPALLGREVGRDTARISQEPDRQAQGGRTSATRTSSSPRSAGRRTARRAAAPAPA